VLKIKADDIGLPVVQEQYLFLVRTVNKMHLDVSYSRRWTGKIRRLRENFGYSEGQDGIGDKEHSGHAGRRIWVNTSIQKQTLSFLIVTSPGFWVWQETQNKGGVT
jgi:hypothetical protein